MFEKSLVEVELLVFVGKESDEFVALIEDGAEELPLKSIDELVELTDDEAEEFPLELVEIFAVLVVFWLLMELLVEFTGF
jgi:hypothetical protein